MTNNWLSLKVILSHALASLHVKVLDRP